MHLRSIKLRGFKSFPDPVEVKLEPGVAVVVGPNGSGKSNVADAIVWAAGSLTPSTLRAEKPDDVLFAGGGDHTPADHCEVELLFDNADGGFGGELDFSEIAITRRLVRGGEGQYLVNRTPVRRTDLVELLADVGLGGSMHSIVSQGKVDAVLASKPEDRRALVEEAAGLGKFKQRKHRAELKLARVATQVERARDVEAEVRKRLRPLALQATAAERAEKLVVEIAGLRVRLARLDLTAIAERRVGVDERRQAAALGRRSTQEKLTSLLAERERAEEELSDAAGRRETALGALYRLQGATERLTIRSESATALQARLAEELADAEQAVAARTDEAVIALEAAAVEAAAAARDAAQASGQAAERARVAHARVAAAEAAVVASAETRLEALRRERTAVETQISGAGGQDEAQRRRLALGAVRERLGSRREGARALLATLTAEHADAKKWSAGGDPTPAHLEQTANEAAAAARAAASERDDLAERARATRERLGALELSIAEREGLTPAARALAELGERLALAEVAAEPGSERAVAAALGHRASALLAGDTAAALRLVERARADGLGSLVVLVGRDPQSLVAELPVVPLDDLLDSTRASVTVEGFGFDPARGELWFAGETAEAVLLEMEARRRTLADESEALDAQAKAAVTAAAEAAAAAAAAEEAYAAVAHLRDRIVDPAAIARARQVVERLEGMLSGAAEHAVQIDATLAAHAAAGAERSGALGSELRRLSGLEEAARAEAADATTRARAAEVLVARLGGAVDEIAVDGADTVELAREAARLLAEAELSARAAREATDRARMAEAALVARAPRRAGADPDLLGRLGSFAELLVTRLGRASALASRFEAPVRARADAGATRAGELGAELRRLGAAEVELRRSADEAAERLTATEVELARLDGEAEEAGRRLEEASLRAEADDGGPEPADSLDRDELVTRIERLDARRESLGQVNPLAREEYEAEKERLEELAGQRQDLEASLDELEKLRDELADTVARRFDETFAAVSRNFTEVAETLFPGGEGRLRLVDADEEGSEPGIEVELRPAGKRITRLTLLSGGEKALGAISFLFALFLAKPCPFYLLDEVEAALDDTNIARFVELLRRYADRAQFVVITHQKRTMEAADVLYGVTMGGDGVSQIVSRRLPRHEHAAMSA
jgi:chromosome segregation protein